jgi:hypothetical protein
MKLLAIAGKLGSGKSTVARHLARYGAGRYPLAEGLRDFLVEYLGFSRAFVYEADKDSKTHLRWRDMPHWAGIELENIRRTWGVNTSPLPPLPGPNPDDFMTLREVLEEVGTGMMRRANPNVWVDRLLEWLDGDEPEFAVVDDMRFPNELKAVQNWGGKIIRLTRVTEKAAANRHWSNEALDPPSFPSTSFDSIVDNHRLTLDQTLAEVDRLVRDWGWA